MARLHLLKIEMPVSVALAYNSQDFRKWLLESEKSHILRFHTRGYTLYIIFDSKYKDKVTRVCKAAVEQYKRSIDYVRGIK